MKYIFRGHIVFEYLPEEKTVIHHKIHDSISAFDYCKFIDEDYKLLSEFFYKVYQHTQGETVELSDIEVH